METKMIVPESRIDAPGAEKFVVGALFRDAPGIQNENLVCESRGIEAVNDPDRGSTAADELEFVPETEHEGALIPKAPLYTVVTFAPTLLANVLLISVPKLELG